MSRSTHTNALIKAIFAEQHNQAHIYNEDTGEYDEALSSFRALADQIDNLDQVRIRVINKYTGNNKGWFLLMMCNDGEEQLSDYSANDWADAVVKNIKITGDE